MKNQVIEVRIKTVEEMISLGETLEDSVDLNKYSESASKSAYNRTHPTALGYHKLASEIAAYISYIIKTNLDGFEDVQFIGM